MWWFKTFMAVGDYMTAGSGMRGRAAQTTWVRSPQEQDTTQHNSGKKLVFTKSHDPNNFSKIGWTIPGPRFRASSEKTRAAQRSVPRGGVVRIELEINVAPCIAGGRDA